MRLFLSATALAVSALCCSCSEGGGDQYVTAPPARTDTTWADSIAPIVKANCGPCHGVKAGIPVFDTGAHFKGSNAKAELTAGAMPPAGHTISDSDKAALLAYLQ